MYFFFRKREFSYYENKQSLKRLKQPEITVKHLVKQKYKISRACILMENVFFPECFCITLITKNAFQPLGLVDS